MLKLSQFPAHGNSVSYSISVKMLKSHKTFSHLTILL